MEAHPQQVKLISDTSSSAHALTFPTIDVSDKTAGLVSGSLNMRSKTTKHAEEASDALEGSTYDLLDELNLHDETASTVSMTSFDDDTPDDSSSLRYDEESDDQRARAPTPDQDDAQHEPVFEPSRRATGEDVTAQSDLTVRPGQPLTSSVVFHEPEPSSPVDSPIVTRTMHTLEESYMSEARLLYGQRHLTVIIEQTMSQRGMPRDRPFHVLYVGDASQKAKNEIICKIASAMAVSTKVNLSSSRVGPRGPARYTVVAIPSFEDNNDQPEIELIDSSGIEILIDECTAAEPTPHGVNLIINGKKRALYSVERPIRPDLVIFFHSDHTPRWFSLVRPSMEYLGLPCLDISETPLFNANRSFEVDATNIHMRIGIPRSTEILDRLPVDLATFLDVDAGQLNRHLAYITGRDNRERLLFSYKPGGWDNWVRHMVHWVVYVPGYFVGYIKGIRNDATLFLKDCTNLRLPIRHRTSFWLLLSSLLMFILSAMIMHGIQSVGTTSQSSAIASTTAMTASKVPLSQFASGPILATPAKAVSTPNLDKAVGQPLLSSNAIGVNDSSEFKVHILGDNHVILTPPKQFAGLKKPPQLFLRVAREHKTINASLEKLAEGAYAIAIEREQAYGNLNVSIWTKSKPVIAQNLTLNFGSPYLKLSTYKGTAAKLSQIVREEANLVQSAIEKATTDVSTTLQAAGKQISNTVDRIQDGIAQRKQASQKRMGDSMVKAAAVRKAVGEHLMKTQALVQVQVKERMQKASNKMAHTARTVKSLSNRQFAAVSDAFRGARMADVLEKAPSVRRSKTLLKARKNALGLLGKANKQGVPKPVEELCDKERMKKSCKCKSTGSRRKVHAKELC